MTRDTSRGLGAYSPHAAPRLTPRQAEVAELLAAGLSRRGMARQLGVSEWTVKDHVRAIAQKLPGGGNVRSRAAAWCIRYPPNGG